MVDDEIGDRAMKRTPQQKLERKARQWKTAQQPKCPNCNNKTAKDEVLCRSCQNEIEEREEFNSATGDMSVEERLKRLENKVF